jgi:hypothetical protein
VTWRDKLEIGLKEDAPYRKDNLPANEIRGPEVPTGPGRSPEIQSARGEHTDVATDAGARPAPKKPRRVVHARSGPAKPDA